MITNYHILYPRKLIKKQGRFSGLFYQLTPSHLMTVAMKIVNLLTELTATGTAPDFNRIPFY